MRPEHTSTDHYDRVAVALHWVIALLLIGQIAFGFMLDDIAPRKTPSRAFVINLHKSFGLTLGLLIVLRIIWRLRHAPPPWPAATPASWRHAARWGHRLLYAFMVVIPLAGATASNFSKYGIKFYGWQIPPWGADRPEVYAFFNRLHVYAAWVFAALILGHVAMALKHAWVDRDASLHRIWPWGTRRIPG
jgi:cytochrome b561